VTQALPIARDGAGVDLEAACRAAADFLSALGVAIDQEDLRDTPTRMARAEFFALAGVPH
jgi:GTP cyclohydrolase IA